jgi:transcriptional regulator with XRE-family HTH domain
LIVIANLTKGSSAQDNSPAIRKKLKLSQCSAAAIAGGGVNAFSRYENGKAKPVAAVINLLRLLDKHPELINEIPSHNSRQVHFPVFALISFGLLMIYVKLKQYKVIYEIFP